MGKLTCVIRTSDRDALKNLSMMALMGAAMVLTASGDFGGGDARSRCRFKRSRYAVAQPGARVALTCDQPLKRLDHHQNHDGEQRKYG